jgi:hypothetical protein
VDEIREQRRCGDREIPRAAPVGVSSRRVVEAGRLAGQLVNLVDTQPAAPRIGYGRIPDCLAQSQGPARGREGVAPLAAASGTVDPGHP